MTEPQVTLGPPPPDLAGYPALTASRRPRALFRICMRRDRVTGALSSPWRFGAVPPGAARFDLPAPAGTCYWSDRRYGSWVEVWRGTAVVDRADVARRALFRAVPPPLRLADTLSLAAHRYGGTGELSTVVPYDLPQAWAAALHAHGFAGLVARCRHDPGLAARTVAVFGTAGVAARRAGWSVVRTDPLRDRELAAELAALGVVVADVPHTVPVAAP